MALLPCPECGQKVSDQATACPSCGHPLEGRATGAPGLRARDVQTVEQTGKRFKGMMAGGVIAMILGLLLAFSGWPQTGMSLAVLGLAAYIAARSGAWWHHG